VLNRGATNNMARMVSWPNGASDYGEVSVWHSAGVEAVRLDGLNQCVTVQGNPGISTTVGYNKSGGGTGTLIFTGGVLTASF